jgi:hypothetical protein
MDARVVLIAALAVLAPAAPQAHAGTVTCRLGYYWPGLDDAAFPTVARLRAADLPRRTDHYAPRCLVAEAVAGLVKDKVARAAAKHGTAFRYDKHAPRRVTPMGARWYGGVYRVRYGPAGSSVAVTATHGHRRVTFRLGGRP